MLNLTHRIFSYPPDGVTSGGASTVTYAASTAMMTLSVPRPVRIIRWGTILTTAPSGTGTLQFRGDIFPLPQAQGTISATGATTSTSGTGYNSSNAPTFYVDTGGGTLSLPSASASSVVAGSELWHKVNPQAAQTGGYYPAPETALIPPGGVDTQLVLYPGQSFRIFCVSVLGTTAGAGIFFVEADEQAFQADFSNNAMVLSGYPSSNGTVPTPSWPFPYTPFNGQS